MDAPSFLIRPATAHDGPALVALVRALAEYERIPGPDDAAAERLMADVLTGRHFDLLLAESDGRVAGYALFFFTYSTFLARPSLYLEDLFVLPTYWRCGIGTAFMRRLATLAVERGCGRFEWTVLDWNHRAQDFYASMGARLLPDWRICRLEGEALEALGHGECGERRSGAPES